MGTKRSMVGYDAGQSARTINWEGLVGGALQGAGTGLLAGPVGGIIGGAAGALGSALTPPPDPWVEATGFTGTQLLIGAGALGAAALFWSR